MNADAQRTVAAVIRFLTDGDQTSAQALLDLELGRRMIDTAAYDLVLGSIELTARLLNCVAGMMDTTPGALIDDMIVALAAG